jgi:hypothetical protein
MYRKQDEKTFEDDIMKLMKGFFFNLILNDPMIRFALKSYLSWFKSFMCTDKSPLNKEILLTNEKVTEIQNEWTEYIESTRINEFATMLLTQGVYQKFSDLESVRSGCVEWSKPLWF